MADVAAKKGAKPGKPVFKLASPYATISWPLVAPADHDIILDMLVNLLAPIGRHRSTHIQPSKGRRSKKRKRHDGQSEPHSAPAPPPPDVAHHVTVGVNSTTRHLEQLAARDALSTHGSLPDRAGVSTQPAASANEANATSKPQERLPHLPLIFTLQPASSITTAHLPLLAHTSSSSLPTSSAARLIPLRPSSEPKLAAALGVPRVGVVGVMAEAPGAEPLIQFARDKIAVVDVPWLHEAQDRRYLEVNVLTEAAGIKA